MSASRNGLEGTGSKAVVQPLRACFSAPSVVIRSGANLAKPGKGILNGNAVAASPSLSKLAKGLRLSWVANYEIGHNRVAIENSISALFMSSQLRQLDSETQPSCG